MAKNLLLKQQVLMANKGKIKIKQPKKWLYPMQAERTYVQQIQAINKIFWDKVKETIVPSLPFLVAQAQSVRGDSVEEEISKLADSFEPQGFYHNGDFYFGKGTFNRDENERKAVRILLQRSDAAWVDQMKQLVDKTYLDFSKAVGKPQVDAISMEQAQRISSLNKTQFVKVIHSAIAVNPIVQESWLQPQMKAFQAQNTDLITKLSTEQRDRVQQTLYRNLSSGKGIDAIKKELDNDEAVGKNRSRLIARDQTNKFNGQLTQLRQKEVGVESYIWTTSRDERVRPSHALLDGKKFEWSNPPAEGNPGEPIQCRCIAQPVITDAMFDTDSSVPIVEQEQKPKVETAISSIEGFKIESQVKTIKYSDKFDKEDLIGLNEYQLVYDGKVGGYRNINNFLRKNKLFDEKIPVENVKEYISKIDSAINKGIIIEDTKLYRGVLNGSEYKDLKVGEVFSNKSFLSTTTERTLAENWAYKKNDDEFPVIFNITAKKGTNAVYMLDGNALDTIYMRDRKKSSYIYEEKEVLLKRNQKFKVLKTDSKNGYLEITVETD